MPLAHLHTAFESRPLSSTRVTSLPQYYEPLCHPDNPIQFSRITGWHVPCHCQGFPCCHFSHLACVPVPIYQRKQTSAHVAHFPICHRPSPYYQMGRLPHRLFRGLPSIHSHSGSQVRQVVLDDPFIQNASDHVVTSMIRPGCYQPERQLLGRFRTCQRKAPFHGTRHMWASRTSRPTREFSMCATMNLTCCMRIFARWGYALIPECWSWAARMSSAHV